jgi:hypothetical protein
LLFKYLQLIDRITLCIRAFDPHTQRHTILTDDLLHHRTLLTILQDGNIPKLKDFVKILATQTRVCDEMSFKMLP